MPQLPKAIPSVITVENTNGIIPSVKFSREKKKLARFAFCKTVGGPSVFGFFLFPTELATEQGITDDQYFNGQISSVRLSVKILLTNCVPYTDEMNPSVKLFNGIVRPILSRRNKNQALGSSLVRRYVS
jgi:hypothetical protein